MLRRRLESTPVPFPVASTALARAARPVIETLESRRLLAGSVLAALEAEMAGRQEWLEESSVAGSSARAASLSSGNTAAASANLTAAATGSPSITSATPANNATGVLRDTSIRLTVNLPNVGHGVDSTTLGNGVKIYNAANNERVNSIRNTSGGGDIIVITPRTNLAANTKYTVEITDALRDTSGARFEPFKTSFTTGTKTATTPTTAAFSKTPLANTVGQAWTAVTFGPDGRLYAATQTGSIYRFQPNADGTLQDPTIINTVRNVNGGDRLITGIEFDPRSTAASPILFVSHGDFALENAPNWTGKVTKLSGANLGSYQDVVTGLPRSVRDHLNNQVKFGPDGALYMIQGSMSAAGAPDTVWGNRSETLLSGAVLRIDVDDIGGGTRNVQTGDGGSYDPFASGADVSIYASGIRNAYDMVWHSNGHLYVPANGTAAGGNSPAGDGAPSRTDVPSQPDYLFRVRPGGYYGHPNPSRGEYVLFGGNPTSGPDHDEVGVYPVGTDPDDDYVGSTYDFGLNFSPNGVIEYKGGEFGGTLDGKLMIARFSAGDDIVILGVGRDGTVTSTEIGVPGLTTFTDPLDLIQDPRSGFIYVAEFGGQQLTLLKADPAIGFNRSQMVFSTAKATGDTPRQKIVWTNQSDSNVTIGAGGVRLIGVHSDHFRIVDAPSSPVTLAPGQSLAVRVVMRAGAGAESGLKRAFVRLQTTDGTPPLDLPVRGIVLDSRTESSEPSLQSLLDTHNIGVRVADDEVSISTLYRARSGPVTIEPLGVFAPGTSSPVVNAGLYTPGNPKQRSPRFSIDGSFNNEAAPQPTGGMRFDPGTSGFGLFAHFPAAGHFVFSEDGLNSWEGTTSRRGKVRFFPLRNSQGATVRHAYVAAFEAETGSGDHQDLVYVIHNVTPQAPVGELAVTSVNLINAATDTSLGRLPDGGTIDITQVPEFSLQAVLSGTPGSVRFAVDGVTVRTENFPPHTIAGENASDSSDILPFSTSVGTHTLTVTPFTGSDASGSAGTPLTMTFHVTQPPFTAKINFQPAGAPLPRGYVADVGRTYATKGNGLTYGWNGDIQPNSVDRNNTRSPDQRYDSFIWMAGRQWQIKVPNGRYRAHLVIGDPVKFDAEYGVSVEGAIIGRHTPSATSPWVEQRTSLTVSDGTLTLTEAPGSRNNKLAYLHIEQVG